MTCTKCGGLVINDCGDVHCLNCGRRVHGQTARLGAPGVGRVEKDTVREPDPVPVKEEITVRTGWTPERHAKFKATLAAKREARGEKPEKPKKAAAGGAIATIPEKKVRVLSMAGTATLAGLDEAIATLQDDLAALERAKGVLGRL